MTSRLVLATSDSGAGHLKMIGRGTKVLGLTHRLVCDVVPAADNVEEFFAARASFYATTPAACGSWDTCMESGNADRFAEVAAHWTDYDEIELWADPLPNAQLVLIQFLTWFSRQGPDAAARLRLVQSDTALGNRDADDTRSLDPSPCRVNGRHLLEARSAWEAFRNPTPERWAGLLDTDLAALPWLHRSVKRLLQELPAHDTALGATERRVLSLIAEGENRPSLILAGCTMQDEGAVLDYWEIGKVLDRLSSGSKPAVLGLCEGPFDDTLHMNRDRHRRFKSSRLSLSEQGTRLLEGISDFTEHGQIDRWWGGTRLTNAACWRWDGTKRVLVPPSSDAR